MINLIEEYSIERLPMAFLPIKSVRLIAEVPLDHRKLALNTYNLYLALRVEQGSYDHYIDGPKSHKLDTNTCQNDNDTRDSFCAHRPDRSSVKLLLLFLVSGKAYVLYLLKGAAASYQYEQQ